MEPTDSSLPTIAELICAEENEDTFGTFCTLIRLTGVDFILNGRQVIEEIIVDDGVTFSGKNLLIPQDIVFPDIEAVKEVEIEIINNYDRPPYDAERGFTVFAPTNQALELIPDDVKDEIAKLFLVGDDVGLDIVLNHIIPGRVLSFSEVVCGRTYGMLNAEDTLTVCPFETQTTIEKQQVGNGNIKANGYPTIQSPFDKKCSNGIIHAVSEVILPSAVQPPTASPTGAPTLSSAPSSAPSISSAPSQAPPPCPAVTVAGGCLVCGAGGKVGNEDLLFSVNSDSITCGTLQNIGLEVGCPIIAVRSVKDSCACEECTPL
jgi:hypothetical protein